LPVSTRREVAKALEASPNLDSLSLSGGEVIVIHAKGARREVKKGLARLRKAQQTVVSDPEIMRGAPV
jgi:hypothetical protein